MIAVSYYLRAQIEGQYSLERVFQNLVGALGNRVCARVWRSRPGLPAARALAQAGRVQSDVNHITGHVHYVALLLDPARTVLTVHDIGHLAHVRATARLLYRWLWFEWPLRRVARIVTVSQFTRQQVVDEFGLRPADVRVIHNCVPAGLEPSAREFHAERPTILVVGTAPHKNAARLVEAVAGLRCRVLFVGRVPDTLRATLAAAAVEHEEHAHVTDAELADCYRRADVVYFASTHEGFGLPIVEAQAVGRPVITSRLCSMPEVAGDAALFVDPYDVQAIRAALLQLIESADLRAELVSKGFANVSRFDRAAFAEAHLDVYRGLAS